MSPAPRMAVACLSHSTSRQGRISCTPRFHYPQRTLPAPNSLPYPPNNPLPPSTSTTTHPANQPPRSEIRTHITTLRSIPQASEYLYSFPAYTEDAYCRLDDASAECLVTATGGALTVPMFTNRRTLAGDGFWDGWREAVVTDEMPRSYVDDKKEVKSAIGKGGEGGGEERVFRKSTVSELVQTREGGRRGGAGKVGTQPRTAGVSVPRETGRSGNAAGMGTMVTMVTTAKPVVETDVPEGAQVDIDSAGQRVVGEGGEEDDVDWVDEVVVKTKVVVETIVVTELAIVTEAHGGGGMVNGSELEEL